MHTFVQPGDRMFVLLAAGNLATTQSVVKRLRRLPACLPTVYR
jgi:putative proteasome-type protease